MTTTGLLGNRSFRAPRHVASGPYDPANPRRALCGAISWVLAVGDADHRSNCPACLAIEDQERRG